MTPGGLLALSDERDTQLRLRHGYWAEGWRGGYDYGWKQGYEQACADLEALWHEVAAKVARGGPSHAELERRRWTVHGEQRTRDTYGQPHPADRRPAKPRADEARP
jgi:hypothetical protein